MPLPAWLQSQLADRGIDLSASEPTPSDDEQAGITLCTCRGEGCAACNGDGVIYP